jgi:nitrile hydratase accessory protein
LTPPEQPFDAPWQAQLFALTVALNEAGHLPWSDWAALFGPRVQHAEAADYWQVWAEALAEFLDRKGIARQAELATLAARWQAAAEATPHGQPVRLTRDG